MVDTVESRREKLLMSLYNQEILLTRTAAKRVLADYVMKIDLTQQIAVDKLIKSKKLVMESEFVALDAFENIQGFTDLASLVRTIIKRPESFTPNVPEISVKQAKEWLSAAERGSNKPTFM